MFGRWLSVPEGMPSLELLVAAYFAARDRQQRHSKTEASALRLIHAMSDRLLVTAATTRAYISSISALGVKKKEVRVTGTRELIASPR